MTFRSPCAWPSRRRPSSWSAAPESSAIPRRLSRRPSRGPAERATDREVGAVAAVLVAASEKAAAYRLGVWQTTVNHHLSNARSKVGAETTAQLVWILGLRLPEPEGRPQTDK